MTREQLDAIRARYADEPLLGEMRTDRFGNLITVTREHPVVALLAEIEGMRESCTGLVKQNERQYDEVVRLTSERDTAFARGVAAMRQAAVEIASKRANLPKHSDLDSAWCRSAECILNDLRHLPDPEDKS